jgi:hypothetical protein
MTMPTDWTLLVIEIVGLTLIAASVAVIIILSVAP